MNYKYAEHLISCDWEGQNAYYDGIKIEQCPYTLGTPEHKAWIEGWEVAEIDEDDDWI